jgi:ATP-dependent Lon protease
MRAPLLPLRDIVVFPHMVAPLFVGRERSVSALEYAMRHDKTIFLATQRDARVDEPAGRGYLSYRHGEHRAAAPAPA